MSDFGNMMHDKCMYFAIRIVNLCKFLNEEKHEYRIADQLFRSATSIGANYAEAQCAISKNDFIAKTYISLKECNESLFWIELLKRTNYLSQKEYESIYENCNELKRLFTSITKNSKNQLNNSPHNS